MTRADLALLVEHWRAVLIPEWRIDMHDKPWPDAQDMDDYWAISSCHDDYPHQKIHFPDESLERDPVAIETTVVHELLHALTRPWRVQVNQTRSALAPDVHHGLYNQREHEEEQLVDRLSRALVAQRYGLQPYGVSAPGDTKAMVPSAVADWQRGAPLMVPADDSGE